MQLGRGLLVLTVAWLLTAACDVPGAVAGVQQFALRTKNSEPARITPGPDGLRSEPRPPQKRPIGNHLKMSKCKFRIVNHSFTPAWKC